MSLGEAKAKFPGATTSGQPPSPSPENPGQVFPRSDPHAAPRGGRVPTSILANPYAMRDVFDKLDHALAEAITAIEHEEQSAGASGNDMTTVQKLKDWQMELAGIREGGAKPSGREASGMPQEGGFFTD